MLERAGERPTRRPTPRLFYTDIDVTQCRAAAPATPAWAIDVWNVNQYRGLEYECQVIFGEFRPRWWNTRTSVQTDVPTTGGGRSPVVRPDRYPGGVVDPVTGAGGLDGPAHGRPGRWSPISVDGAASGRPRTTGRSSDGRRRPCVRARSGERTFHTIQRVPRRSETPNAVVGDGSRSGRPRGVGSVSLWPPCRDTRWWTFGTTVFRCRSDVRPCGM